MIVRVAAGLIGLAVLLPALILGGVLATWLIVGVALVICIYEYASMAFPEARVPAMAALLLGVGLPTAAHWFVGGELGFAMLGLVAVGLSIRVVLRPGPSLEATFADLARYLFGVVWLGQLAFLPLLRSRPDGLALVFMALGLAWLSDTGAYFSGRLLGRTPLHAVLSPKKTVEGYLGGVVAATLGTAWFAFGGVPVWTDAGVALQAVDFGPVLGVGLLHVLVVGIGIGTLGVLGDLTESLVKRATGVKDAGSIMPGHGGLLDRVDSLLFVAPALYGYALLVEALS